MRLTDFWQRMNDHFGAGYARSWARDTRLSQLGGQTVEEALDTIMTIPARKAYRIDQISKQA